MGRLLSIDYGLKRVGIAVSDPLRIIATPLDSVDTPLLFSYLDSYISKENVEVIVVGMPMRLLNTDTHITEDVRKLVVKLQNKYPKIPIRTVDERYTSVIANSTILASGVSKKRRKDKKLVDKISASLILQTYMQQNGN